MRGEMPLMDQDDNCPHWASQGLCEPRQVLTNRQIWWSSKFQRLQIAFRRDLWYVLMCFKTTTWKTFVLFSIKIASTKLFDRSPTQGPGATENGELCDELRHTEGSCGWRGAKITTELERCLETFLWHQIPEDFLFCTGARTTRASAGLSTYCKNNAPCCQMFKESFVRVVIIERFSVVILMVL